MKKNQACDSCGFVNPVGGLQAIERDNYTPPKQEQVCKICYGYSRVIPFKYIREGDEDEKVIAYANNVVMALMVELQLKKKGD